MARLITASERIRKAHALVRQALDLPVPPDFGRNDLSYIAGVKALLQQARDLVKFIPNTPTATEDIKKEVSEIYKEAEQANRTIFRL
jgi:hypothetical protein